MDNLITVRGHIDKSGTLRVYDNGWQQHLKQFKDTPVLLTVQRKPSDATSRQMAYYHAVIVPHVKAGLRDAGEIVSSVEADFFIRESFCRDFRPMGGKEYRKHVPQLAELSKEEMSYLVDAVIAWAAQDLERQIPYANEYIK